MDSFQNNSLDTRIEQLETTVGGIQQALRQFDAALSAQGIALPPLETAEAVEQVAPPTRRLPDPAPATSPLPRHTPPSDAFAGWATAPMAEAGMMPQQASATPVQPVSVPSTVILSAAKNLRSAQAAPMQSLSAPDMEEFAEGEPLPEEILHCAQNDSVPTRAEPRGGFDIVRLTEYWMNKVAIGLLLFGVVFLFQYSVAQGWLTEPIRVDFGYALGLALLVVGLRLYEDRPHFSQVLLGGSVGTLYITTYAANQVFLLMPYIPALITMVAVTALAFGLSVRQNSAILSLIGTVGGLATPFLLYTGEHNVPGLMAYTCVLLAGTSAVYFYRGWHSLLWTSFVGVWGVLIVTITAVGPVPGKIAFADWTALEFGIVFAWLAFSAVPVVRDVLWVHAPERWQHPRLDFLADMLLLPDDARRRNDPHIHLMAVLTPFLALMLSTQVVVLTQVNWGRALVVISLVYALAYLGLRRRHEALAYTHELLSLAMLTVGLVLILEGPALFFALALEGAALHFVSGRIKDKGIATLGHVVSVPVILWLGWRLAAGGPMSSVDLLTNLAVIGLLLASAIRMYRRRPAAVYLAVAHIAFMGLLMREFYNVTPGLGAVLVAWAAYGTALHLLARRQIDLGEAAGRTVAGFTLAGHSAFVAVLALLGGRLLSGHWDNSVVIFNLQAGINFLVIGLAFGCAFLMRSHLEAQVYRSVAHVALLGLLVVELLALPYGQDWAMLACVVYATALHYIARRRSDRWASLLGHAIFAGLLPWLGLHLFATYNLNADWATTGLTPLLPSGELPIFNLMSMVDLAVILLAFYTTTLLGSREERLAYRMLGHVAALGWLWRELSALPHGWDYMVVAWAVYAAGLFLLTHQNTDRGTAMTPAARGESLIAHSAFAVLVPALLLRLLTAQPDLTPFLNIRAAADLAVIALAVAVSKLMRTREEGAVYRFLAHGAILALLWRELILLPGGNGLVTVAWGVYALAILFVGLRLRSMPFIYTAIATLMLVIAKLFLVDLSALELIWRSLLFIGFGVVFLMLSYHLQSWLRRQTSPL